MDYPKRKSLRLKHYDYGQNGAYFITLCTYRAVQYFGNVGCMTVPKRMIISAFQRSISLFDGFYCPKMVVMPNHLHAVVVIQRADMECSPTIQHLMQTFKRISTIEYCKLVRNNMAASFDGKLWQRSYFERVIRNDAEYVAALKYIDENPLKWLLRHNT